MLSKANIPDFFYTPGILLNFMQAEAKRKNIDFNKLLSKVEIKLNGYENYPQIIPLNKFIFLTVNCIKLSNDPAFLINAISEQIELKTWNLPAVLVYSMPDLSRAMKIGVMVSNYSINYAFHVLTIEDKFSYVRAQYLLKDIKHYSYLPQIVAFNISNVLKYYSQIECPISKIEFPLPPDESFQKLEELLKCPLSFGHDELKVIFSSELLKTSNPTPVNDLQSVYLMRQFHHIPENLFPPSRLHSQVKRIIASRLHMNNITVESVAQKLNMTKRTLQDRLKSEDTSFRDILDSIRLKKIIFLLMKTNFPQEYIARRSGFVTGTAMNQFVKKVTGRPAKEFSVLSG